MNDTQIKTLQKVSALLLEQGSRESSVLEEIENLKMSTQSQNLCAELLRFFVHATFEETEAQIHWEKIFQNYDYFAHELNHDVGLRVAIFDYFVNLDKVVSNPIMVEIHVLKETEKLAMVDSLTGIFNRRYFDASLNKEIKRARRYGKILSILMMDLDDFKNINDTRGHLFGDKVLARFARILSVISREEDINCRYGGEEFVVIMPETNSDGAVNFDSRLRERLQTDKFFRENRISYSGGITCYPRGGEAIEKLLKNADEAMYQAKFSGKDRSIVHANSR